MRLIHTGDIHLDSAYAAGSYPAGFGNRRRHRLRDVVTNILRRAAAWPADAVLIAGDLFEDDRVTRDTVAYLRDAFEMIRPIPVFISPGNHDPYTAASPYATESWPSNVHIFTSPNWQSVALEEAPLTVHGFAFDGPDISSNPFGSLRVPEDGRVHVAVGHGSEANHMPEGAKAYNPFDAATAAPDGLHYLALGHFHVVTEIAGDFDTVMRYAGAPEGHGFDETGPRHSLEVEIDEDSGPPPSVSVNAVRSSLTLFETHTFDCGGFTSTQNLVDELRKLARDDAGEQVVRVKLTGSCPPSIQAALDTARDAVSDRFAHLELVDKTHPAEDYAVIASEGTSLGVFVQRISAELNDAPDEKRAMFLSRVRELGLNAYRGRDLPIRGIEGGTA